MKKIELKKDEMILCQRDGQFLIVNEQDARNRFHAAVRADLIETGDQYTGLYFEGGCRRSANTNAILY